MLLLLQLVKKKFTKYYICFCSQYSCYATFFIFSLYNYIASALFMSIESMTTAFLTISWTLDDSVTATSYTISYSNTNTDCFTDSDDITGIAASETMYTLTGLQEGTEYSITVTVILSDGETEEDSLTVTTGTAGQLTSCMSSLSSLLSISHSQLHLLPPQM